MPLVYFRIKRYLDFIFAGLALILLSPVFLFAIILIAVGSRGPVFFKQERVGYNTDVFTMFKFRTMVTDAEAIGSKQISYKDDPRVTRIGRLLRTSSLDELPQLINIIKGEMSFIGPRPVLTYHPFVLSEYSEQQKKRFSVYPGISGLAQVEGRRGIPYEDRFKLDAVYVDSLTFKMDIKIFFKTIFTVFSGNNNSNIQTTKVSNKENK